MKNEESFCKQAKKLKWIESTLSHVSEKVMQHNGLTTLGKSMKGFSHLL
jgi:hypothetical protein